MSDDKPHVLAEQQLEHWFTYHPAIGDQPKRYALLRAAGRRLALEIIALCPAGADRDAAIRHVRDAVHSANASIACGGE